MTNDISAIAITPSQLAESLLYTLPFLSVMIHGNIGLGKSQMVRESVPDIFPAIAAQIAKDRGIDIPVDEVQIWERRMGIFDLLDFGGLPYNDNGIQRRAMPDIWPNVGGTEPVYGVLFLDEFTQAGREKQTVVQRLFDEGQVGDYVLPGHYKADPECKLGLVLIILAGNRQKDKAQSHGMGMQTGNRLAHFTLEPSVEDWLNWGRQTTSTPRSWRSSGRCPSICTRLIPARKASNIPPARRLARWRI